MFKHIPHLSKGLTA